MSLRDETRAITRLALPIIGANLGWMAVQVVDTLMIGRYSDVALAGVALASTWIAGTLFFGLGVVMGMDPIVTQAHGARDERRMALALQRGLVLSTVAGLVIGLLWCWTEEFLLWTGQDPELARIAEEYSLVQIPSAIAFLCYSALRQYLQGREITRPILGVVIFANLANAALNWLFIYGHLGFPEMGVVGAGLATSITRCLMPFVLLGMMIAGRMLEGAWVPWSREAFALHGHLQMLRLGLPSGFQISLEMWAFGAAALMAGKLGQLAISAHAIVINIASFTFMVPLGLAAAATTRVGNLIGAGRGADAQRAAWCAMILAAGFMALSASSFLLLRDELPMLYTRAQDLDVRALCAIVLPIAAAFQIFDGLQVVGGGVLRGQGSTLPAALMNLVGYWVLALPFARIMAFEWGLELRGIWWGLAIGLAIVAVASIVFIRVRGTARAAAL